MHAFGLINLLIVTGMLITSGNGSAQVIQRKDILHIPGDHFSSVKLEGHYPISELIRMLESGNRIKRNEEKIPLMIGKGSTIVTNKTKVNGSLSDLKVDCRTNNDCSDYIQSVCFESQLCNCTSVYPVFVASQNSCIKPAEVNTSCSFTEQCVNRDAFSECDSIKKICVCVKSYFLKNFPEIGYSCVTKSHTIGKNKVDPAMITVLVGLGLMFVIICVVLRLFAKARFRENRSIFNTPNPRLMNASLFKDSKLLSPARGARRGSNAPGRSRTASICSVNKDTPRKSTNGSLNKERRGSALSNVSATGSAAGSTANTRAMLTSGDRSKGRSETTVAIEAVD